MTSHERTMQRWLKGKTPEQRLAHIAELIEGVDGRAMAADGPVTPTRQEISDDEMREIYWCARGQVP